MLHSTPQGILDDVAMVSWQSLGCEMCRKSFSGFQRFGKRKCIGTILTSKGIVFPKILQIFMVYSYFKDFFRRVNFHSKFHWRFFPKRGLFAKFAIGSRVLARIIFKRAKKHVATTMTAVSATYF
jgi:hypothetical protein